MKREENTGIGRNILRTIAFAIAMLITTFSASAASTFQIGPLLYKVLSEEDRTVEVTDRGYGVPKNLEIPKKIIYSSKTYTVTSIGEYAFSECTVLTSVTIPNSVTSIGEYAFSECTGLTSVTIPNSVTSIGNSAFKSCWRLTSVTIGNSVTSIGNSAFESCPLLTEINVSTENNKYASIDGVVYSKDLTSLFLYPRGKTESQFTIPNSVTSIGESAFEHCSKLTSITIPNSVTSIGEYAFYWCSGLTSVTIPNSVTSIGESAFEHCSKLTSITIPNSVTSIGNSTFCGCSKLTNVTIPNSVTSIGKLAFYDCSGLTSVTIPNSVTSIGSSAFSGRSGLETIYCYWDDPISCAPIFSYNVLENAVLYIPFGRINTYEKVDPWRNFWEIKEMDYSGIESINGEGAKVAVNEGVITIDGNAGTVRVYSASGQLVYSGTDGRVEGLTKGIYIVTIGHKSIKVII